MLSLPASPLFRNESEEDVEDTTQHNSDPEDHLRPPLLHTKSDTHISWRSRQFRKDSPPRIIASDHPDDGSHLNAPTSSNSSHSAGSDQDLSNSTGAGSSGTGKGKHISFNTFVEQCIAIEKPKTKRRASSTQYTRDVRIDDDGSVLPLSSRTGLH